ncbi:MAG: NAD(P)-binding protein, partial [Syntrophomonadaceae bacterium]|nr:NAD(P)-binding protein [Syntrophomonadaceae bacterium]
MPHQPAEVRRRNFNEVALGLSPETAVLEAQRCIQCKNRPCVEGCPVEIDIPTFIEQVAKGDFAAAIGTIKQKNNLPAICGRVCPQENQCEKYCTLGKKHQPVAIGRLERFVADWELARPENPVPGSLPQGRRVAVIGSGPSGLTAAADLAGMGYRVTVFEALHTPGGVLVYGIPEFRLPKDVVEAEVEYVRSLGVELRLNW